MQRTKIVILNWNGKAHLERFLPSVLATSGPSQGVVVADNGSTDGSMDYVRQAFPQTEIILLDRNYGYAGGYNRALEQIGTEYAVLMNSDVQPQAGWLEPIIEYMDREPTIAAVAPKILSLEQPEKFEYAGASGGFLDYFGYPFCRGRIVDTVEQDRGQYNDTRDVFWASGACLVVRMSAFREVGGLDETFFAHMEEIDLCWRLALAGYRVSVVPRSAVLHLGGGTLSAESPRKLYLNYRNNLAMIYKNASPGHRRVVIASRMILDAVSATVYLIQGSREKISSVRRAHRDFRKMKPALSKKRKEITPLRPSNISGLYNGSILLRYFLLRKKFFGNLL